ncbi:hypothetical protein ACWIUD_02310 [Helicobacter sp. 23-1044]
MRFEICLEDFRVSAIIGILPSERTKAQNLKVDLRVEFCNSFSGNHSADSLYLSLRENNLPSLADGKSQSLPLPCGGGLRGWVNSQKNSGAKFSNSDFTHPLTPSAREGEQIDSTSAREGGENVDSAKNAESSKKSPKSAESALDSTNIIDYAILREMILATLKANQFFYLENALVAIKEAILAKYPQILRLEIGIAKLEIFDDCVPRVRLKWSANDRFSD